jgi:hypothetical protein
MAKTISPTEAASLDKVVSPGVADLGAASSLAQMHVGASRRRPVPGAGHLRSLLGASGPVAGAPGPGAARLAKSLLTAAPAGDNLIQCDAPAQSGDTDATTSHASDRFMDDGPDGWVPQAMMPDLQISQVWE